MTASVRWSGGRTKGLVAAKLTPVLQEKFDRAKPDFAPIAAKLSKADAQAVLIIARSVRGGRQQRHSRAGSAAQIVTLSNNASTGFIKSLAPTHAASS